MVKFLIYLAIVTQVGEYYPTFIVTPVVITMNQSEQYCSCCEELIREDHFECIEI